MIHKQMSTVVLIMMLVTTTIFSAQEFLGQEPVNWDTPPGPVGGYEALSKNIVYPPDARDRGLEGETIVRALIDTTGQVIALEMVKSDTVFDKYAKSAVYITDFTPAMKGDTPVKSWIIIPINFYHDSPRNSTVDQDKRDELFTRDRIYFWKEAWFLGFIAIVVGGLLFFS